MTGRISLKLVDSWQDIAKDINAEIAVEINKLVQKNFPRVIRTLKASVKAWVSAQPEIASLTSDGTPGSLNAQFGLIPGTSASIVDDIVNAVADSVSFKFKPFNKNLRGTLELHVQPKDFQNVLSTASGTVVTRLGAQLDWLEWLLTRGDSIIIVGYHYAIDGEGRSGGGVMKKGGAFRVDPSFSGTLEDNFITRALDNREKEVSNILESLFV
jgi:hypothetical protein